MLDIRVRRSLGAFCLDVAFRTEAHEILAVQGPSGSGKTTLVNLLAGLERPDAGRIVVGGRVLFDSDAGVDVAPEKRNVGYVFQDCRLFPHLSVAANLGYGRPRPGSGPAFDEVVELLGLAALLRRRPRGLSGGEAQRVAIGRALLANPRMLLLDEPLASLDRERKNEILPFVRRLRDAFGLPIVYVSHAADEIASVAERTIRIEHGRLVEDGAVELAGGNDLADCGLRLVARVRRHDAATGQTELSSPLGPLWVRGRAEPPGTLVRVALIAGAVEPIDANTVALLPDRAVAR